MAIRVPDTNLPPPGAPPSTSPPDPIPITLDVEQFAAMGRAIRAAGINIADCKDIVLTTANAQPPYGINIEQCDDELAHSPHGYGEETTDKGGITWHNLCRGVVAKPMPIAIVRSSELSQLKRACKDAFEKAIGDYMVRFNRMMDCVMLVVWRFYK